MGKSFESQHRRGQPGNPGQFRSKDTAAPAGALSGPGGRGGKGRGPVRPLHVVVLDVPDPKGGFDTHVNTPTGERYLLGGKLHREDGPAYVGTDGTREYRRNGVLDRTDGPAYVDSDGYEEHWVAGRLVAA